MKELEKGFFVKLMAVNYLFRINTHTPLFCLSRKIAWSNILFPGKSVSLSVLVRIIA